MRINDDDSMMVTGINVTPLVDITLVLLIIFMVTATFISEQGLSVNLPKVATKENAPSPAITVSLNKEGIIKLMKKEVSLEELTLQMKVETRNDQSVKILVKADREVPYENLAQVLDAVKQGGVLKVALAVNNK